MAIGSTGYVQVKAKVKLKAADGHRLHHVRVRVVCFGHCALVTVLWSLRPGQCALVTMPVLIQALLAHRYVWGRGIG